MGEPEQRGPYTIKEIEKLAKDGDPRAAYDLATLYARGDELPRDFAQAARWFKQAATQGIAGAQYNLGVLYEQGLGVAKNLPEAIRWYLKSADQGYPPAEYNIGTAYAEGQGCCAGRCGGAPLVHQGGRAGSRGRGTQPRRALRGRARRC